jgi:hypothetical protein
VLRKSDGNRRQRISLFSLRQQPGNSHLLQSTADANDKEKINPEKEVNALC